MHQETTSRHELTGRGNRGESGARNAETAAVGSGLLSSDAGRALGPAQAHDPRSREAGPAPTSGSDGLLSGEAVSQPHAPTLAAGLKGGAHPGPSTLVPEPGGGSSAFPLPYMSGEGHPVTLVAAKAGGGSPAIAMGATASHPYLNTGPASGPEGEQSWVLVGEANGAPEPGGQSAATGGSSTNSAQPDAGGHAFVLDVLVHHGGAYPLGLATNGLLGGYVFGDFKPVDLPEFVMPLANWAPFSLDAWLPVSSSQDATTGGPSPGGSPLAANLSGMALAVGNDTVAFGRIESTIVDDGRATTAQGTVTFVAAAETHDGTRPLAIATSQADVTGADIVITFTTSQFTWDGNSMVAVSTTRFAAVDLHGWAPADGPMILHGSIDLATGFADNAFVLPILGNLATGTALGHAVGANSVVDTMIDTLAVQNQMSVVHAQALVGIG